MKKRFRSGIKTARTRTFPGADVVFDHDMVMMIFQTRLKNSREPTQPIIRFDLEKLNDPTVTSAFQATKGRFVPLTMLVDPEIVDLCDQRRDWKKKRGKQEEAKDYRDTKRKIRTEMKMAKETGGLSPPPQYFYTDRSKAVLLLWFLTVLAVCVYTLVQLLC